MLTCSSNGAKRLYESNVMSFRALKKNYIGATDLGSNLEPNRMRRLYIQFSTFYFLNEFDSIEPTKLVIFCYTLVYWRTDVGEDRKIKVLVFFCVIDLRWKFYIFLLQVFFMLVASFNGLYFYVLRPQAQFRATISLLLYYFSPTVIYIVTGLFTPCTWGSKQLLRLLNIGNCNKTSNNTCVKILELYCWFTAWLITLEWLFHSENCNATAVFGQNFLAFQRLPFGSGIDRSFYYQIDIPL